MSATDRPLTLAFVMDPIEKVDIEADTSFALMLEAQRRGDPIAWVTADPASRFRITNQFNQQRRHGSAIAPQAGKSLGGQSLCIPFTLRVDRCTSLERIRLIRLLAAEHAHQARYRQFRLRFDQCRG